MDKEIKYIRELFLDEQFMKHIFHLRQQGLARAPYKRAVDSKITRELGNVIYRSDQRHDVVSHRNILNAYSLSIALAPMGSEELAVAYGNRSAFLFHMKQYESCLLDIDRALKITVLDALKNKLLSRKARCKVILKSIETNSVANKLPDGRINKNTIDQNDSKEINKDRKESDSEELISIFKSVDIRYTEKHGRQLVANRDFRPGEIIFSEKFYTACLHIGKSQTHCTHCLTFCWSTVPCENCHWAMFCSEECKKIALRKYHDIECSIVSSMNSFGYSASYFQMTIRSIILAIREAGSIEKLKEEIRLVDESKDMSWRGIKHEGQFLKNKFSILYGISGLRFSDSFNEEKREGIMLLLLSLMDLIPILENNIREVDNENLINDSDTIFFGSLITRILNTQIMRSHNSIQNLGKKFQYSKKSDVCMKNQDSISERGLCFAPVSSFINHSCYPNTSKCITEDQRIIIYALHPIRKNSEIFESYCAGFDVQHRVIRQRFLDNFQLTCDCLACKQDWLPYATLSKQDQEAMMNRMKSWEKEIYMKYNSLLHKEPVDEVNIDGAIQALAECITSLFKEGKKPSILLMSLINSLMFHFTMKYNYHEPLLEIS